MVTVAGIPNRVVRPSVSGAGTGGIAGGSDLTYMRIIAENPTHFYRMNTGSGITAKAAAGTGDGGWEPRSIPGVGVTYAIEQPMSAAEPLTEAIDFDGSSDRLETLLGAGFVDAYTAGTLLLFFQIQGSSLAYIFGQCNTTAISIAALRLRGDTNNQTLDFEISRDGTANFYRSTFDLGSQLPESPNYNMVAIRQPNDTTGIDWFFNGTFYTVADAEVTEASGGTLAANNDAYFERSVTGAASPATRQAFGCRPNTARDQFFDGRMFEAVNDSALWSDASIEDLWLQAVANGLTVP